MDSQRSKLTSAQRLMWLGSQLDAAAPLYNMVHATWLDGSIDADAFALAFSQLVRDTECLRGTVTAADGEPHLQIAAKPEVAHGDLDLSAQLDPEQAAQDWLDQARGQPLLLDRCLYRSVLLQVSPQRWVWFLCIHHLVCDAQSFALLYEAMAERYALALSAPEALEAIAPLPPFSDYQALEQRLTDSPKAQRSRRYWQEQLSDAAPVTTFYGVDHDAGASRSRRVSVAVCGTTAQQVRSLARGPEFRSVSANVSLAALWSTIYAVLLHRISGTSRVSLGTPFQARPGARFKATPGAFVEVGLLNVDFESDDTFASVYQRILQRSLHNLAAVVPGFGSAALNRSYSTLINFVTVAFEAFADLPASTQWLHSGAADGQHAVRLQVCDFDRSGDFTLHFDFNESVFDERSQNWFTQHFDACLTALLRAPEGSVGDFALPANAADEQAMVRFNGAATDIDPAADQTVVDLFRQQARRTPDALAVIDGDVALSYAQLDGRSDQLAALLQQLGCGIGTRVALCLPRSVDLLVAMWATLKSGAAFCPLEPAHPTARLIRLLEDLQPAVLLTDSFNEVKLSDAVACCLNLASLELVSGAAPDAAMGAGPDDIAYLMYTSGSTGMPKAAMLGHQGLRNYLLWVAGEHLQSQPQDFALYSSIAFDLTITSLFVPVLTGACIRVYRESRSAPGLEILEVFADDAVDVVKLTPAHLQLLVQQGIAVQRISTLILGGEDLLASLARSALAQAPGLRILNEYGPTEATVGCMLHSFDPLQDQAASVPLGVPAANMQIELQDAYGQRVPPGVVGEMVISGPGVGLGYWQQPTLTRAAFADDGVVRCYRSGDLARWHNDGLVFLGRRDEQIKLRGVRIETGEIEAALLRHPQVEGAAVTLWQPGEQDASHCTRCGLSSRYPEAQFDEAGVCADCRDYERYEADVDRYFGSPDELQAQIRRLRERHASQPYDCVALTSGGKDSTYMLYQLVREYGARPLVFTLDNGYISERALNNVAQACEDLGLDLEIGKTEHMGAIFADSLQRHCNVCNGCFKTIYTLSLGIARKLGLSTIVTGLSRGQLFETRLADTFKSRQFDPAAIDALVTDARKVYHRVEDAVYELIQTDLFDTDGVFDEVEFVDFYRYVDVGLDVVYDYLDHNTVWRRPDDTGRSTNCLINDAGIYVHKKVRGYHNYSLPYSWDVRLGHKVREVAMGELDDDIDEVRVYEILDEIGYDTKALTAAEQPRLVAYYAAPADCEAREVRQAVAEALPANMVPSSFVRLDVLPLTPNGKVHRSALPEPPRGSEALLETPFVAPDSPLQQQLVQLWQHFLGVERVGINDNFFELGGDSVACIQIAAAAQKLGLTMTPAQVFAQPSVAALAVAVATEASTGDDEHESWNWAPDSESEVLLRKTLSLVPAQALPICYPLTATQTGMLYQSIAASQQDMYVGQISACLAGTLDFAQLQAAYDDLVAATPVLRTRFFWKGLEQPIQVVEDAPPVQWRLLDWRSRDPAQQAADLAQLAGEIRADGLSLDNAVPLQMTLVRETDARTQMIWTSHHLLFDGWSTYPLLAQWFARYQQRLGLSAAPAIPAPRPYADYLRWVFGGASRFDEAFWRRYLDGVYEPTMLPVGDPAYSPSAARGELDMRLPDAASKALERLARAQKVTLNAVFQAAWAIVLSRYCRTDDVIFGATWSGRNAPLAGIDEMVGLFINTLPMRLMVPADGTISTWLPAVQGRILELAEHESAPLGQIQQFAEGAAQRGLFECIVVFENHPDQLAAPAPDVSIGSLRFETPSHYPLVLLVFPQEPLRVSLLFDEARFSQAVVSTLASHLRSTLIAIATHPDCVIADLDMRTDVQQRLQSDLSQAHEAVPASVPAVLDLLARAPAAQPAAIAVRQGGRGVSYAELDRLSRQVANVLLERGVGVGDRVALLAERSIASVVGMLAALRIGAPFVPIAPDAPATLARQMLQESRARVLLASGPLPEWSADTIVVDSGAADSSSNTLRSLPQVPGSTLAYVLYTSGSSGQPKGVMVSHDNLAVSLAARREHYKVPVSAFLHLSSFAFDSAMAGLFWTLIDGGELLLPEPGKEHSIAHLLAIGEQQQVSHLLALPSLYGALLEAMSTGDWPTLQQAVVAGERCEPALVNAHFQQLPDSALDNEYGPTEATIWSHVQSLSAEYGASAVPIGYPIAGMGQWVVDQHGRPLPAGVPGELWLAGPAIAQGYLDQPALTAERFLAAPATLGASAERVYRTGDLVRMNEQGRLEFLGRMDRQLKIRGYRVEPDQVESVLESLDAHEQRRVVVTGTHQGAEGRLLAFVENGTALDTLRTAALEVLPDYMVPVRFESVPALPRLSNGKLDRVSVDALPLTRRGYEGAALAPNSDQSSLLCQLCAEVLGVPRVDLNDGFMDLGGDSIAALRLAARLHRAGYDARLQDIVETQSLLQLDQLLVLRADEPTVVVPRSPERETFPLSSFQQRLWFIEQLYGADSAQILFAAYRLEGPVDNERLQQALHALAIRHEILRTVFQAHAGRLEQRVLAAPNIDWHCETLAADTNTGARLNALLAKPLSLTQRPPWQAVLVTDSKGSVLLLRFHHMVMDGESLPVLLEDLSKAYAAVAQPAADHIPFADAVQYGDYARWQSEHQLSEQAQQRYAEWLAEFRGALPILDLPLKGERPPSQSFAGQRVVAHLATKELDSLRDWAQAIGVTLAQSVLAAYTALLLRYANQNEVVIGMPVDSVRHRIGAESAVGPYLNTAAMRLLPQPDGSFADLVRDARRHMRLALERGELSFEQFVSDLALDIDLARSPVFQALYAFRSTRDDVLTLGTATATAEPLALTFARTDIALWALDHGDRLQLEIEYPEPLFERALMTQFLADLERLLSLVPAHGEEPYASLARPLTAPAQSRGAQVALGEQTVVDLVRAAVQSYPERTAVSCGDRTLTYRELGEGISQVAEGLRGAGVGHGDLVALAMTRSEQLPVAMLGVLAAGAAYVPLDLSQPAARLQTIIADADPGTVLVDAASLERLPDHPWQVLDRGRFAAAESVGSQATVGPDDRAYVMFTSGSTGRPKGVVIGHRQINNLLTGFQTQLALSPDDVFSAVTTIAFDISVLELFWPLTQGARSEIVLEQIGADGRALAAELARTGTTIMQATPASWRLLLDSRWQAPTGFRALCGGDSLPRTLAEPLAQQVQTLWNLYGPTETTVWSSLSKIEPGAESIDIGRPLQNTQIYIVDQHQRLVPSGAHGEIAIAGAGLALEYWGQPALTAERFVPNPFDSGSRLYLTGDVGRWLANGQLAHLGRKDGQIKLRGFRVEVGEIEYHLERIEGVAQAAVARREGTSGEPFLAAFVVAQAQATLDLLHLRRTLRTALPVYMLPQHIVLVDELPATANNKLDRRALQDLAVVSPDANPSRPPQSSAEHLLAEIWCELLDADAVSVSDDFIMAGGHSLLVIKLIGQVEQRSGVTLDARDVFSKPLIELARQLEARAVVSGSEPVPAVPAAQRQPATGWRRLLGLFRR